MYFFDYVHRARYQIQQGIMFACYVFAWFDFIVYFGSRCHLICCSPSQSLQSVTDREAYKVILGKEISKSVRCFQETQLFWVYDPSSV